jgi:hypothetical protein
MIKEAQSPKKKEERRKKKDERTSKGWAWIINNLIRPKEAYRRQKKEAAGLSSSGRPGL